MMANAEDDIEPVNSHFNLQGHRKYLSDAHE